MSSQGANATTISPGYAFDKDSIRDASDWITYKKQTKVFKVPTDEKLQTEDPWIPYGNGYRLTFLNGKFKCGSCPANAFGGLTGPLTPSS